ncbi:MAG: diaminopimelate epimerase [Proteobacteria bacterium]|nr:diaminopimelate epimerase [Pseudomonadota bacterium]
MRLEFTKMHGLGNDFAVFDAPAAAPVDGALIRQLSDRHTGIGFDQALVLEPPRRADSAVFYRIFNADGVEVEQCGNGARCIAALLAARGLAPAGAVTLDSPAGLIRARTVPGGLVCVDMGPVRFDPRALPFDAPAEAERYPLEVAGGGSIEIGAVSIGNPHAILAVASVDTAPVERFGPAIERHPRFPKRVNAGFMQIIDRTHIRLRVYERGAGETQACGTGACAAVAVGRHWGELDRDVHVSVRGGELRVNWNGPGENIWLTGPAEVSFAGHVEV